MRARLALTLVLCLAAPPAGWTAAPDSSPSAGASSLAAPAGSACALVRNSAKAEKTLSGDWMAVLATASADFALEFDVARAPRARHLDQLDFQTPPRAPRAPPTLS